MESISFHPCGTLLRLLLFDQRPDYCVVCRQVEVKNPVVPNALVIVRFLFRVVMSNSKVIRDFEECRLVFSIQSLLKLLCLLQPFEHVGKFANRFPLIIL